MPLPIDVKPYILNGVLGGDNYMTHYKAVNEKGEDFVITEFYPAYMVQRNDDGTLEISGRFSKEFVNDLEEFVRRAESFKHLNETSLHPCVDVFEKNHTAYMVRRGCGLTTVDQYMGSATMDFDEAYYFLRPLILAMAQASEKGMMFNISPADFRVNSYKNLVLAAPPSWDNSFHAPLVRLIKLYYRLITGTEAAESAPAFSAYGLEVPPRIEAMVMEILSGDILYGSLDDFYKKFKSLVESTTSTDTEASQKTLARMRGLAAALFVVFALSLTALAYGAVQAHRAGTFWASPEIFVDSYAPPAPLYDFSEITLTHPRNVADPITGSFAIYDGFMFFRGEEGMKSRLFADVLIVPGAVGISTLTEDRVIVPGALPSYIVGHRNNIFFVDAASEGRIYRTSVIGENTERVTEYPALNLAVIGDYLFYTDVRRNHHLYRMEVRAGNRTRLIFERPVHATLAVGRRLFFIAEDDHGSTSLYVWRTDTDEPLTRIAANAAGGLRVFADVLFYLDTDGRIRTMDFYGREIAVLSPENVRTFDVFFQWVIFAEEGVHIPRAYNILNENFFTLSSTEWVSYIWVHEDRIYALDHRNPSVTHTFNFPT